MDRDTLWRRVAYDYHRLKEAAPAGLEPVVEVFITGRNEPVELGFVETRRGSDEQWIRFQGASGEPYDTDRASRRHDEHLLHVHESLVGRVELRYRRVSGATVGFSHSVASDEAESSPA